MRTTAKELQHLVDLLNKDLPGRDYSLGCAYGGYRLERKGGSVDVSPRLKAGELSLYIHGMLEACDQIPIVYRAVVKQNLDTLTCL